MRKLKYRAENSPQAWFFLLPALIIIGVFSVFPLIRTFIMAFQKGTLNSLEFNGFKNFEVVLS
ncbi:MAG: sugar ABC transporter permease, partial [Clostridium sp.]|nr:sugar ABC transporter permease [Clostridium sp.]